MHNTKKYLHTFNSGFARIKLHVNCFVFGNYIVSSKSLFDVLKKFFKCIETRSSKLGSRTSKLDSRKLWGSRIESRRSSYIWAVLYVTSASKSLERLMKLIGAFSKCHGVCGNNCRNCSVKDLLVLYVPIAWKFRLNMNFLLPL